MPRSIAAIATFRDLLLRLDRSVLASDIGISPNTVASWLRRDRIPVHWWEQVIDAALVQGLTGVTFARLRRIEQRHAEDRTSRTAAATRTAPQRRGGAYVGNISRAVQVAKQIRGQPPDTEDRPDDRSYVQYG